MSSEDDGQTIVALSRYPARDSNLVQLEGHHTQEGEAFDLDLFCWCVVAASCRFSRSHLFWHSSVCLVALATIKRHMQPAFCHAALAHPCLFLEICLAGFCCSAVWCARPPGAGNAATAPFNQRLVHL